MHQTAFHYPELAGFKAEGTSQEAGKSISGHSQNVLAMTPANERIAA